MFDNAADVEQGHLRQAAVGVAGKQVLAIFLQRLVHVHAVAIVVDERLGHESRRLAERMRNVVHDVFEDLHLVGFTDQRIEADPDLALARRCHFVVMNLGRKTHVLERKAHRRADVMQRIDRRDREVTAFNGRPVARIALVDTPVRVPCAFVRIDFVERTLHRVVPGDVIENEELVLRAEKRRIGDTRRFQVCLGALGERARAAIVTLHRRWLDHVAAKVELRFVRENIEHRRRWIGQQNHVRLVDSLPTRDRRAVKHFALLEEVFVDGMRGHGDVLFFAFRVRETKVDKFDLILFDEAEHLFGLHDSNPPVS